VFKTYGISDQVKAARLTDAEIYARWIKGDQSVLYEEQHQAFNKTSFRWCDLIYIGLSRNVAARYAQHLACLEESQEEKNAWVRGVLAQGRKPLLWILQDDIETIEEGRAREQYYIRYAISQGAKLFNKQITYTPEERVKAHQERAAYYAQIQELLLQGHFVKRSVYWHPSSVSGFTDIKPTKRITSIGFLSLYVKDTQGEMVALSTCPDTFFDTWIKQYLSVIDGGHTQWTWSDRLQAINAADRKVEDLGLLKGPTVSLSAIA
jgi:hypothetical protein